MTLSSDHFSGCLLGLASGDALGAPYEGGFLEQALWRAIGRTRGGERRWTDDTQMSLDLAESWLARGEWDLADLARRFAKGYAWSRGYGQGTAKILKRIQRGQDWQLASTAVFSQGSYGNGAAMRAPVVALFYARDFGAMLRATSESARITHAHPLGIEGALLVALATYALLHQLTTPDALALLKKHCADPRMAARLEHLQCFFHGDKPLDSPRVVVAKLGNGMTAETSCVTAIYIAFRFRDATFEEMMAFVRKCGGDVDTIAAMSGAMWGAANGEHRLPVFLLEKRAYIREIGQLLFDIHELP
ncbi:putative hydrolase [Janthinobacterium sp. CG23_2]|nr:putative hydrolase [Janthinobacterium sp. CG23_2]CUU29925.1 putative hydrolase [Janthinobacterium sp. CG23_2]